MLDNMFLVCVSQKTDTGIFEIVPVCTVAATNFFHLEKWIQLYGKWSIFHGGRLLKKSFLSINEMWFLRNIL